MSQILCEPVENVVRIVIERGESGDIKINEQWCGVEYNEAVKIKPRDLRHCDPSNSGQVVTCVRCGGERVLPV